MSTPSLEWYNATTLRRVLDTIAFLHTLPLDARARINLPRAIEVATTVLRFDSSPDTVIAALLRSVTREGIASRAELETRFGVQVADLVQEVIGGDNLGAELVPTPELRAKIARLSAPALLIKFASMLITVKQLPDAQNDDHWATTYAAQVLDVFVNNALLNAPLQTAIYDELRRLGYTK